MKKRNKVLLAGIAFIAGQAIFNNYIYNKAEAEDEDKSDKYFDWKFGNINYKVQGTGEPLLFLHDMYSGFSLNEWQFNINLFSKHYKVYTIDLLGYGFSDKPKITYNSYLYASLVNDFINNVIEQPTTLITSGYSYSIGVFASFFKQEKIKKIIMVSPKEVVSKCDNSVFDTKFKQFVSEMPVIGDTIFNIKNSRFFTEALIDSLTNRNVSIRNKLLNDFYLASHRQRSNSKFVGSGLESGYLKLGNNLAKFEKPTLIIWDKESSSSLAKNYQTKNESNIKLTVIGDTNSLPHMESPKEFYSVCNNFIKD